MTESELKSEVGVDDIDIQDITKYEHKDDLYSSSWNSNDDNSFQTSSSEGEVGDERSDVDSLEFLVYGKKIEEVHVHVHVL